MFMPHAYVVFLDDGMQHILSRRESLQCQAKSQHIIIKNLVCNNVHGSTVYTIRGGFRKHAHKIFKLVTPHRAWVPQGCTSVFTLIYDLSSGSYFSTREQGEDLCNLLHNGEDLRKVSCLIPETRIFFCLFLLSLLLCLSLRYWCSFRRTRCELSHHEE